jgi:hypothetical protein
MEETGMKRVKKHCNWILGLAIAAGSVYGSHFFWLPPERSILHEGDPASVERLSMDDQAPIAVQSVLPGGETAWKIVYVDHGGISLPAFLNSLGEELFGKKAYAMGMGQQESHATSGQVGTEVKRGGGRRDFGRPVEESVTARVPNVVHIVARHPDGSVFYDHWFHNLRTNAGATWQEGQMAGTPGAACTYIALTNTAITPNATDTTLSGEITSNGLARTLGTASYTAAATSYTVKNTFTATASQAAQATGLFTASSGGTMCFENTFTQVSLNTNDTLTVTWTISF